MNLLDSISAPGSKLEGGFKPGGGDDRYAFDEQADWACVIDGATDVGAIRVYRDAEADAARFAEIFALSLQRRPIGPGEAPRDYFAHFTRELSTAALVEFRIPLADAPLSCLPTAAATWFLHRDGVAHGATLGDTVALVREPGGAVHVLGETQKPAEESERARRIMAQSLEDRMAWLRETRAVHNTPGGYWVFGVQPEAASHVLHQSVPCPAGSHVLLMTDGFYRLVSPYGRYADAQLVGAALARGLGPLLLELRALEQDPGEDQRLGRFKTSDDATALLFEV